MTLGHHKAILLYRLFTMKQTIVALASATSLLFGTSDAVLDLYDGTKALKRVEDMKDTTPMTSEEAARLKSWMVTGRLHAFRPEDLPENSVFGRYENSGRSRVLRKGPHKTTRAAQKPKHQLVASARQEEHP